MTNKNKEQHNNLIKKIIKEYNDNIVRKILFMIIEKMVNILYVWP